MIYTDLFKLREDMARPADPGDRHLILTALTRYSDATWDRCTDGPPEMRAAMLKRGQAIDALIDRIRGARV
jgi:hypothetical protein